MSDIRRGPSVSKTKLWSLQFSCRRLAREARTLGRSLDENGSVAREVEEHLAKAAQMIQATIEQLGPAPRDQDLSPFAFGNSAWSHKSPLAEFKAPQDSSPGPDHKLALRGSATLVALPDLLTFLCSIKKTGVLLVDAIDERFAVELREGDIVHAHSDCAPAGERLGDVLVEQGVITQVDLDALLAGRKKRGEDRLGARLIERGYASTEQLLAALELQIRRLFHRLFTTVATELVFWEGPCVWGEDGMRLNATKLLLDGARAMDESSRHAELVQNLAVMLDVDALLSSTAAPPPASEPAAGPDAATAVAPADEARHLAHPLSSTPQLPNEPAAAPAADAAATAPPETAHAAEQVPAGDVPAADDERGAD